MYCKKMIYSEESKLELIGQGTYKGFKYYVINLGTHPTAYVGIAKGRKYWGYDYHDIPINVHGDLTYSDDRLFGGRVEVKQWIIGWDYAHWGDYLGWYMSHPELMGVNDKKWTTEEIIEDCKSVIDQIVEAENNEEKTTD